MSAADAFFDTNVLLYLLSEDAAKVDRTEDLQDGQRLDHQLTVKNPFATS